MERNKINQTFERLSECKVVPIVRAGNVELADLAIQRLKEAGFKTVEITLTIPHALSLIQKYSKDKDLIVGAGTVLTEEDVQNCIDAGAEYVVAPCIVDGMPQLCREAGVVSIMSGLTPSEIYHAWLQGSDIVKVFPVNAVGGASYIKSIKTIFPNIALIPTGGVELDNMNDFIEAGSSLVGIGSSLVDLNIIGNKEKFMDYSKEFLYKIL